MAVSQAVFWLSCTYILYNAATVLFLTLSTQRSGLTVRIAILLNTGMQPAVIAIKSKCFRRTFYAVKKKLATTGSSARVNNCAKFPVHVKEAQLCLLGQALLEDQERPDHKRKEPCKGHGFG